MKVKNKFIYYTYYIRIITHIYTYIIHILFKTIHNDINNL